MKVVIFAGGFGSRLSEETTIRPKPMVEIGGRPILWHIMKSCAHHGLTDFVILGGYRVEVIRDWIVNYRTRCSDMKVDLATGQITYLTAHAEPWTVTVLDTGVGTMTGGRLKRARRVVGEEPFVLTYGDGVSDIDLTKLIAFHRRRGLTATVTAVAPSGRFGVLGLDAGGENVVAFREKDKKDTGLVNGGFFVCQSGVFDVVDDDSTVWEQEPMDRLVRGQQLAAYRHDGFWHAMDNVHDRAVLEQLWSTGRAPWKVWQD